MNKKEMVTRYKNYTFSINSSDQPRPFLRSTIVENMKIAENIQTSSCLLLNCLVSNKPQGDNYSVVTLTVVVDYCYK